MVCTVLFHVVLTREAPHRLNPDRAPILPVVVAIVLALSTIELDAVYPSSKGLTPYTIMYLVFTHFLWSVLRQCENPAPEQIFIYRCKIVQSFMKVGKQHVT